MDNRNVYLDKNNKILQEARPVVSKSSTQNYHRRTIEVFPIKLLRWYKFFKYCFLFKVSEIGPCNNHSK